MTTPYTFTQVTTLFTLAQVAADINVDKLATVLQVDPQGHFAHRDGGPATCSWYRDGYTVIFNSYRRPAPGYAPGCYTDPAIPSRRRDVVQIAVGTYRGEPGVFSLYKKTPAVTTPFDR